MKLESNSNRLLKGKSEAAVLQSALKELIPITSKIRRAKVATAYIDAAALFHFLSHIESAADGKSGASVEIYVQRSSLQSLCRELRLLGPVDAKLEKPWRRRLQEALKRDGEKNNFGQVHLSIFSVSFGTLFHSKAIFLETNNSHRAIVGSINLTANGLTNNEELFVSSEDLKDRITIDSKFIKSVDAYISRKSLTSKSESIGEGTVITLTELIANQEPITTDSLRSVLIEGRIWYERNELQAFAFPLEIPEQIKKFAENIGKSKLPYLKNSVAFALPVLDLLGEPFRVVWIERSRWRRRLCVPTCFGLWAPKNWCAEIEAVNSRRADDRRDRLIRIRNKFTQQKSSVLRAIGSACEEIWEALQQAGAKQSFETLRISNEKRAEKWLDAVTWKLEDEQYFEFLAAGLSQVEVPDVWAGNPSDAKEFERTFIDSVAFELGRPKLRSLFARRLLAKGCDSTMRDVDIKDIICNESRFLFRPIDQTEAEFDADYGDDDDD